MPTIVIGGGLIGLAAAQALIDRGDDVLVLEANENVGCETSFANGGMLTPSLPEPWNGPGVFGHLCTSLFVPGAAMKLRLAAIPSLLTWGVGFLRHSTWRDYLAATQDNYRLARYSLEKTRAIAERFDLEFEFADRGTLCIYKNRTSMARRMELCEQLREIGLAAHQLGANEVVDLEPTLAPIRRTLVGGIWLPDDAKGDAHMFCNGLKAAIERQGGAVRTDTTVDGLVIEDGRIVAVACGEERIEAERLIVAAGVSSPGLLAPHGIRIPVQPAKGYSITIEGEGLGQLPDVAIGDDATHSVLTSLGSRLRVAGTAEFAGYDKSLTPSRIAGLFDALNAILPDIAGRVIREEAKPWTGLRPMSNDGRPFIGPTSVRGLFVNTGHGALGWTMAMGSGSLVADQVFGHVTEIDPAPFLPVRR